MSERKIVRSARGEMVDFTLLELKSQLVKVKPTEEVSERKQKIVGPAYVEEQTDEDGIVKQRAAKRKG